MIPSKGNILVSVNMEQKEEATIAGSLFKTGKRYNENFRERNPVIAHVEEGCKEIPTGAWIVCNYSYFDLESPLELYSGGYSIPVDSEIFAIVNEDGSLTPINGNVIVERITKETYIELPEELRKPYINRGILKTATKDIPKDSLIYWLNFSDYEIVYTWDNVERRALKVHNTEITGYFK